MTATRNLFMALMLTAAPLAAVATLPQTAAAASAANLNKDSAQALATLYKTNPSAEKIGSQAKAILIFPNIVKAGLGVGGSYGEGVLKSGGKTEGYYNSVSGSWGLQAGAQSYGYVVFLMTEKAVEYIHNTDGWEIGVGPTVVVLDDGAAKNLSTSTLKDDAYAFIFNQQGLMAGVSIEGSKINKLKK